MPRTDDRCGPELASAVGLGQSRRRSGQGRVDDDVGGDPHGALVGVALAVEPLLAFEGAADVVGGVDDRPVAVDLDAFELGAVLAAAGGLGVLDVGEVEADAGGVELVVGRDRLQRVVGRAARRRTGGRRRRRRRLPQAASAKKVPPPGSRCLRRASHRSGAEGEGGAAVDVDQGVVDQVRVGRQQLAVVDDHVVAELARGGSSSGWGSPAGRRSSSPAWRSLAMCRRPASGQFELEVDHVAGGELVGGQLAAGGVVDDVLADADGLDRPRGCRAGSRPGSSSRRGPRGCR